MRNNERERAKRRGKQKKGGRRKEGRNDYKVGS